MNRHVSFPRFTKREKADWWQNAIKRSASSHSPAIELSENLDSCAAGPDSNNQGPLLSTADGVRRTPESSVKAGAHGVSKVWARDGPTFASIWQIDNL